VQEAEARHARPRVRPRDAAGCREAHAPATVHPLIRGCSRAWPAPSSLALATACAKTGDPHPPVFHVPKPAADLEVRQYESAALLSFSVPAVNTDGSPVTALGSVELFRLAEPRGGPSGPLAEEDFLRRAERIVEVRAADLERYTRGGRVVLRDELRFPD